MNRLLEIDFIKGIAVICMIIFHIYYLPQYMGYNNIKSNSLFLKSIARISQFIFITMVGVNIVSISKLKKKESLNKNNKKSLKELYSNDYNVKQLVRILYLFITALCISLVTYLLFDDWYVKFGIIHFVAVSLLILFKFVDNNLVLIPLNIIIMLIWLSKKNGVSYFVNWIPEKLGFILGLFNNNYKSMDHFPLIPWLSVMINGILIGKLLYNKENKENKIIKDISDKIKNNKIMRSISYLGQYSYRIYLIHYVLIYLIFYSYKKLFIVDIL